MQYYLFLWTAAMALYYLLAACRSMLCKHRKLQASQNDRQHLHHRDAQDRLLWRHKIFPACTQLIMSWKANLLFIIIIIIHYYYYYHYHHYYLCYESVRHRRGVFFS